MPKGFLRALLILVLALTVPIQGFAAVAAGVCMALGHHEGAAQEEHQHDRGAVGAQSHGDHVDQASSDGQGTAGTHCLPCVSCCAAAAILSFSPLVLPERPAVMAVPSLPPLFSGPTLENLDRPPLAL